VAMKKKEKDRTEVVETVGIDLCGALRFVTLLQQLASKKKKENGKKKKKKKLVVGVVAIVIERSVMMCRDVLVRPNFRVFLEFDFVFVFWNGNKTHHSHSH
jgi:hypothetical protein